MGVGRRDPVVLLPLVLAALAVGLNAIDLAETMDLIVGAVTGFSMIAARSKASPVG